MLNAWGELYKNFARIASTVVSVQENFICRELSKVLHNIDEAKWKVRRTRKCLFPHLFLSLSFV